MALTQSDLVTISPTTPHTHTVIFLHGRGDNARNFAASLKHSHDSQNRTLFEALPSFRWVFPQAPVRKCANGPQTWPQWFDVWDVRNFADHEELQAVGLREVVPVLRNLIGEEAAALGGRWDRIVLAGISMGCATSAHVLFNLDVPGSGGGGLAAFLGFSGRCPFAGRTLAQMRQGLGLKDVPEHNDVLIKTPMLLEHCVDDPLVLVEGGRTLRDMLRGYGAQVEWKEYPDGGHWFHSPTGMDDVVDFVNRNVLKAGTKTDGLTGQESAGSADAMDLS